MHQTGALSANASTNFSLPPSRNPSLSLSLSLSLSPISIYLSPRHQPVTLSLVATPLFLSLLSLAAGNHPISLLSPLIYLPSSNPSHSPPLKVLSLTPANSGPLHSPISLYLFPSSNPSNAPHRQILFHSPLSLSPRQGPLALSLVETLSLSLSRGLCIPS